MMDRAVSPAQGYGVAQGPGEVGLGVSHGFRHARPLCQAGGDRRREGAAGPVGAPCIYAFRLERLEVRAVVEHVHRRPLEVAALDDHVARPHFEQAPGDGLHPFHVRRLDARQRFRLVQVRRNDGRKRGEPFDQRGHGVGFQQRVAALGDHHRVHHERDIRIPPQRVRHGGDDLRVGEHARLDGAGADVRQDGVDLRRNRIGRQVVDGLHAEGILRGDRRHGGHAVHAVGREGLQVGLDAGAAAGVGTRDGERYRDHGR